MPHLHSNNTWVVYEWELVPRFYNTVHSLRSEAKRYKHRIDGIKKVRTGGNGRCALYAYSSLRMDIKEALGDPNKAENVLCRFYKPCPEAALFYATFAFADGTTLTNQQQQEYATNASTLKAIATLVHERHVIRGTARKLMPSVVADVEAFKRVMEEKHGRAHSLPLSVKHLKQCLADFNQPMEYRGRKYNHNYLSLVSGKLRNQNSAKLRTDAVSLDILQSLLEHPNQYDDRYIVVAYNKEAEARNLKPISAATVGLWRRKLEHLIKPFAQGWDSYRQTHSRSVKRMRASMPMYLWENDDNHLDLLFMGDDGKPFHRMKGIFVVDSYSDLILGYACVEGEITVQTVKLAYLNAMYYIRRLTGGWYLPHEIKADNWRIATLEPWYSSIAHFDKSPTGSKNRGWIENMFGTVDWKRCLKASTDGTPAVNYTGNNITASKAGYNREASRQNQKQFPHTSEAPAQIEAFVNRFRQIDLEGKGSREMRWLEAWGRLPEEDKRQITDEEFMILFGIKHDWQNSIEKTGVTATLMGQKLSFAVPPALYLPNVGKKVDVYYDPFDLSRVLVTDGERLRFMAQQMTPVPGTYRDMQLAGEGSRAFLNQILAEKKADVNTIVQQREARMQRLADAGIDIEYVLQQGGYVAKEISQAAEQAYLRNEGSDYDPADLM